MKCARELEEVSYISLESSKSSFRFLSFPSVLFHFVLFCKCSKAQSSGLDCQAEPHTHMGKKRKPTNGFSRGYHG